MRRSVASPLGSARNSGSAEAPGQARAGAGEAGSVGALAAIMNAVVDALSPLGVTHLDMPATPVKVWHAIRAAQRS
jgi:CO/xanthine dehydrogenase Mo-binding subunit